MGVVTLGDRTAELLGIERMLKNVARDGRHYYDEPKVAEGLLARSHGDTSGLEVNATSRCLARAVEHLDHHPDDGPQAAAQTAIDEMAKEDVPVVDREVDKRIPSIGLEQQVPLDNLRGNVMHLLTTLASKG